MVAKLQFVGGENYKRFGLRFSRLRKRIRDYRSTWRRMAVIMTEGTERNIETEGSALGVRWKPLSPGYRKRKKGSGILVESGKGIAFLRNERRALREFSNQSVSLGPNRSINYMFVHLSGSRRKNIPARKFLGWNRRMLNQARKILKKKITRDIIDTGRGR